jgi:hypothetical protein
MGRRTHKAVCGSISRSHNAAQQHGAPQRNVLQQSINNFAKQRPMLQRGGSSLCSKTRNALQRVATRCSAVQHLATQCHMLQHVAKQCNTLQRITPQCNDLERSTTRCSAVQHVATQRNILHTAQLCCGVATVMHAATTQVSSYAPLLRADASGVATGPVAFHAAGFRSQRLTCIA